MQVHHTEKFVVDGVEYRDIEGFPGYKIGTNGSLLTCRNRWMKNRPPVWRKFLNIQTTRDGYKQALLRADNKEYARRVHRLVLIAFVGNPPEGTEGRHRNGNRADNRLDNLLWSTHTENESDKKEHGTLLIGEKNHQSKLTEPQVVEIRERVDSGGRLAPLARKYGVSIQLIWQIKNRKAWKYLDAQEG